MSRPYSRTGLLLRCLAVVSFGALVLSACAAPALGPSEASSGSQRVSFLPGGSCAAVPTCAAPTLTLAPDLVVRSGITGDVPVAVATSPSASPEVMVGEAGTWEFSFDGVPPGEYVFTVVAAAEALQVVLVVPTTS